MGKGYRCLILFLLLLLALGMVIFISGLMHPEQVSLIPRDFCAVGYLLHG